MPSGKTHDISSIALLPILLIGLYYLKLETLPIILIIIGYLFSSFMFNGDLDINSRPYNRWLWLRIIWLPYQGFFSHRSIWTHGIIIGTVVRLLYISPILIPITTYFNYIDYITIEQTLFIVLGLELGSSLHSIMDYLF